MRRKVPLVALAAAALVFAGPVQAAESGADVVKANGCMNCHDPVATRIGPSFKEIAARTKNAGAIVAKLKDGKGHMKVNATEAEIKAAVDYVLATK